MYITLWNTLYHIILLYKRLKYLLYKKKKKTFLCDVFYRDMQRDILKYPFFPLLSIHVYRYLLLEKDLDKILM